MSRSGSLTPRPPRISTPRNTNAAPPRAQDPTCAPLGERPESLSPYGHILGKSTPAAGAASVLSEHIVLVGALDRIVAFFPALTGAPITIGRIFAVPVEVKRFVWAIASRFVSHATTSICENAERSRIGQSVVLAAARAIATLSAPHQSPPRSAHPTATKCPSVVRAAHRLRGSVAPVLQLRSAPARAVWPAVYPLGQARSGLPPCSCRGSTGLRDKGAPCRRTREQRARRVRVLRGRGAWAPQTWASPPLSEAQCGATHCDSWARSCVPLLRIGHARKRSDGAI